MKTIQSILLLAVVMGAAATGAAAQDASGRPATQRGDRSLLVEVGRGFGIGYWMKRSDRTDLGVEVGFAYEQTGFGERPERWYSASLSPALKTYLTSRRSLAPYRYLGLSGSYSRSENRGEEFHSFRTRAGVSASAALGLEWFPIPDVSIGGHAGFSSSVFADSRREQYGNQPERSGTVGGFRVGTFASGLRMHLYF